MRPSHAPEYKSAYQAGWYQRNKDKVKQQAAEYYEKNREAVQAKSERYRKQHGAEVKAYLSAYWVKHPGLRTEIRAKRRAAKLQATPPWLTKDQRRQIREMYAEARRLAQVDGIKRHVDHIYPLKGKGVCGLHVPWNLKILTAHDNQVKWCHNPK